MERDEVITKENAGKCNENSYAAISESIRVFVISILDCTLLQICLAKSLGSRRAFERALLNVAGECGKSLSSARSIDQLSERCDMYLSLANDANSSWMKL